LVGGETLRPIYSPQWQSASARKGQCLPINDGDQTTKIHNYKCNKELPNLVSTDINTHTGISQYLFTSADKIKQLDLKVI